MTPSPTHLAPARMTLLPLSKTQPEIDSQDPPTLHAHPEDMDAHMVANTPRCRGAPGLDAFRQSSLGIHRNARQLLF